ncbi:hypothetical protein FVE85_0187 [Porphyridium purpureum]|uniref:Methyltransferase FkbM domain-containing protein n=1 Tax=Porphyridium purpureum TaxID=35688 RepID=A0A5J4YZF0_PORPP|nr:hypothetical protein FVE85_0187 [Porphyridium purpureum]|eukprot:POR3495..scf208_2
MARLALIISCLTLAVVTANSAVVATAEQAPVRYYGKAHKARVKTAEGVSAWMETPQTDEILHKLFFADRKEGTFVEIGAYDGVAESNTKFFEDTMGWTGLLVEANQVAYDALVSKGKRARSTAVHAAVCPAGLKPTMYLDKLRSSLEKTSVGKDNGKIQVECVPASALLQEHKLKKIDLLVIDVEDAERMALSTVDFKKTSVSVVMIEDSAKSCLQKGLAAPKKHNVCHEILEKAGFCLAAKVSVNEFWTRAAQHKHLCEEPANELSIGALLGMPVSRATRRTSIAVTAADVRQDAAGLLGSVKKAFRAASIPFARSAAGLAGGMKLIAAENSAGKEFAKPADNEKNVVEAADKAVKENVEAEDIAGTMNARSHTSHEKNEVESAAGYISNDAGQEITPVQGVENGNADASAPHPLQSVTDELEAAIVKIFSTDPLEVSTQQGEGLNRHAKELRALALRLANEYHEQEVSKSRRELAARQSEQETNAQQVRQAQVALESMADEHKDRETLTSKLAELEARLAESNRRLAETETALGALADMNTKTRAVAAAAEAMRKELAEKVSALSAELQAKSDPNADLQKLLEQLVASLRRTLEQFDLSSLVSSVGLSTAGVSESSDSSVSTTIWDAMRSTHEDVLNNVMDASIFVGGSSGVGTMVARATILLMFVKILVIAHLCVRLLARKMSMQILVAFVSANLWTCTLVAGARAFAKLDMLQHMAELHYVALYGLHAVILGQVVVALACTRTFFFNVKGGVQLGTARTRPALVFSGAFAVCAVTYVVGYFVPFLKGAPILIGPGSLAVIIVAHVLMMGAVVVAIGMHEYEVAIEDDFDDLDEIDLEAGKLGSDSPFIEPGVLRRLRHTLSGAL